MFFKCCLCKAFGNALSCYVAKAMGVPIGKIICSTNSNDIVHRTISKGDISMGKNIEVSDVLQQCTHTQSKNRL